MTDAELDQASVAEPDLSAIQAEQSIDPRVLTPEQQKRTGARRRRLSERFTIPGTMVACERSVALGWKKLGAPCEVNDIGPQGISFCHMGQAVPAGSQLRMVVLMPGVAPFTVKGKVIWTQPKPTSQAYSPAIGPHHCGVEFTDFGAEAYSILTQAEARSIRAGVQETDPSANTLARRMLLCSRRRDAR